MDCAAFLFFWTLSDVGAYMLMMLILLPFSGLYIYFKKFKMSELEQLRQEAEQLKKEHEQFQVAIEVSIRSAWHSAADKCRLSEFQTLAPIFKTSSTQDY